MRCGGAEAVENREHLAGEDQVRRAAVLRRHFNVLPTDAASPTSLQRFQSRFFRRKAGGIMLHGHRAAAVAVIALSLRKHTLTETRRAQQHFANARDFDNVYADGNDHERPTSN